MCRSVRARKQCFLLCKVGGGRRDGGRTSAPWTLSDVKKATESNEKILDVVCLERTKMREYQETFSKKVPNIVFFHLSSHCVIASFRWFTSFATPGHKHSRCALNIRQNVLQL